MTSGAEISVWKIPRWKLYDKVPSLMIKTSRGAQDSYVKPKDHIYFCSLRNPKITKLFVYCSSYTDISQDDGFSVVRVTLKRRSAENPWGIIICGTDETSNAPVFIDSLSPGDPGAASGLLFPGDRILAINGNALHAGHTLTQAMRMLQRYPDRVVLHVARQNRTNEAADLGPSESATLDTRKRVDTETETKILSTDPARARTEEKEGLDRKPSLKKASV